MKQARRYLRLIPALVFVCCSDTHAQEVKGTIELGLDFFDRTCMQTKSTEDGSALIQSFHAAGLVNQNMFHYGHADLPISGQILFDMEQEVHEGCAIWVLNAEQTNETVRQGFTKYADTRFDTPMSIIPISNLDPVGRGFAGEDQEYIIMLEPSAPENSYFRLILKAFSD